MNTSKLQLPAIFASALLCLAFQATSQGEEKPAKATPSPSQKQFDTPQQAADSLIKATSTFEVPTLKKILGPDGEDLISSDDPVMDKERALAFAARAQTKQSIELDPENPNLAVLVVGEEDFPLPIPIVKSGEKWFFDTKAGREEMLLRRIGANELDAIAICLGFVETQHEYAATKHDGAKVNQYAQRIISTPGKRDGLAWKNEDGSWGGPVGEEIAKALQQGYTRGDKPKPFHGYYFKILKGQGPDAANGKMDFVIKEAMIGGFALAAAPAEYDITGIKTFIVSHTGIVYEKDLGDKTLDVFEQLELFNPDDSWQPTEDQ